MAPKKEKTSGGRKRKTIVTPAKEDGKDIFNFGDDEDEIAKISRGEGLDSINVTPFIAREDVFFEYTPSGKDTLDASKVKTVHCKGCERIFVVHGCEIALKKYITHCVKDCKYYTFLDLIRNCRFCGKDGMDDASLYEHMIQRHPEGVVEKEQAKTKPLRKKCDVSQVRKTTSFIKKTISEVVDMEEERMPYHKKKKKNEPNVEYGDSSPLIKQRTSIPVIDNDDDLDLCREPLTEALEMMSFQENASASMINLIHGEGAIKSGVVDLTDDEENMPGRQRSKKEVALVLNTDDTPVNSAGKHLDDICLEYIPDVSSGDIVVWKSPTKYDVISAVCKGCKTPFSTVRYTEWQDFITHCIKRCSAYKALNKIIYCYPCNQYCMDQDAFVEHVDKDTTCLGHPFLQFKEESDKSSGKSQD